MDRDATGGSLPERTTESIPKVYGCECRAAMTRAGPVSVFPRSRPLATHSRVVDNPAIATDPGQIEVREVMDSGSANDHVLDEASPLCSFPSDARSARAARDRGGHRPC